MLNYSSPHLDLLFHALADPTRRAIVERLSRSPATVSELAEPLDLSMPGVLQHIRVLEAGGVIRSEKTGRVRTCRLDTGALRTVEDWVALRRASWSADLDQLDAWLALDADPYAPPQPRSTPCP